MLQPLEKYFPRTFALLSLQEKTRIDVEFFQSYSLPQDLRYFPMMMKQSGLREEIVQTADYEYLAHMVKNSEETLMKKQGRFRLNSTIQWIVLESGAANLGKEPGLYGLWKFQGKTFERKLAQDEAQLISEIREHPELVANSVEDPVIVRLQLDGILL